MNIQTKNPEGKEEKKEQPNIPPVPKQSIAQIANAETSNTEDQKGDKEEVKEGLIVELKKENREMRKMIRDEVIPTIRQLQEQVKNGGTSASNAKDELDALAEEWQLEPKFVRKLSEILLSKSKKQFEDSYLSDINDIKSKTEEQTKQITHAQVAGAISKEFDRVVADNPDLGKVAHKEAVKKYILSSEENLKRTMEDILEELYGEAVKNSAGVEGYSSQGGNHPKEPDYNAPSAEDHKRIAESRERGGEEFGKYQENLIDRLTHRSRHQR